MKAAAPRWRKLGKIFDPSEHDLPGRCEAYAQSPQVLICDGFIRVFFSTRERDPVTGKYLSRVAFVDFDPEFRQVVQVSREPVMPLGELGCFDEHGIFPLNVLRVGEKVYGYTCGWSRRVGVSVETGIGLAISENDGESFERIGPGPVLSATLHEPCLVGDGFVRQYGGQFHMWYIFGHPWKNYPGQNEPDRIYKIAHAVSRDGIAWQKTGGPQLIADAIGQDECQALPTVVFHGGRYHMYFCFRYPDDFRGNPARAYRLGYASSDDLENWVRDDDAVGIARSSSPEEWDSQMMCYPHVFQNEQELFLLYNGNEFGRHGFGLAVAE